MHGALNTTHVRYSQVKASKACTPRHSQSPRVPYWAKLFVGRSFRHQMKNSSLSPDGKFRPIKVKVSLVEVQVNIRGLGGSKVKIGIFIDCKNSNFKLSEFFTECRYLFVRKSYGNLKKAGFRKYRENPL